MAFDIVSTEALKKFREEGKECVKKFADIKKDFEEYNKAFLAEYEGKGAAKYKAVSDLITEKVSDFEDVFNKICESLVDPTLQKFEDLDKYLNEQNSDMIPKQPIKIEGGAD